MYVCMYVYRPPSPAEANHLPPEHAELARRRPPHVSFPAAAISLAISVCAVCPFTRGGCRLAQHLDSLSAGQSVSQSNILEDHTVFGHPVPTQTPWFPPNPDQDLDRHSAGGLEGVGQEGVKEAERDRVLVAAGIIEPPGSCAEGQERAVAELVAAVHLEHLEALHTRHTQMRDTYVTYDRHT